MTTEDRPQPVRQWYESRTIHRLAWATTIAAWATLILLIFHVAFQ